MRIDKGLHGERRPRRLRRKESDRLPGARHGLESYLPHSVAFLLIAVLFQGCSTGSDEWWEGEGISLLPLLSHAESRSSRVNGVRFSWISIGDEARPTLFAHPFSRVAFPGLTLQGDGRLTTGIGVASRIWEYDGDGMTFRVLMEESGKIDTLYSRYIDPKRSYRDRKWHDLEVDIDPADGMEFTLIFETDPGPEGNVFFDWGGWSAPELKGAFSFAPIDAPIRVEDSRNREVERQQSAPDAPNILLLLVDTLRADHLGCYGYERITSPSLDHFSRRAILFEDVRSVSSWTTPAVASLFTGLYPYRHGAVTDDRSFLHDHFVTIAEHLRARGFTTAAFVTNPLISAEQNFDQGFEDYYLFDRLDARATNELFLSWLKNRRNQRFFAYLHYMDPHDPYCAPGRFSNYFDRSYSGSLDCRSIHDLWLSVNLHRGEADYTMRDIEHLEALYDSEIRFWDFHFSHLVDRLSKMGLLEKTIVVVTSDHGEEFLEHGKLKHGIHLYEETLRVPLLVFIPGRGGLVDPATAQLTDIFPTLLHALSMNIPDHLDGRPLTDDGSARAGGSWSFAQTSHAYIPGKGYTVMDMVMEDGWKLITTPETGVTELYNLISDPGERRNLAQSEPRIRDGLRERIAEWKTGGRLSIETGDSPGDDGSHREILRSLGYIE